MLGLLSLGFGARDVGMDAAFGAAEDSLDRLNGLMEDQSKIAKTSGMNKFMERVKQFNVASIASNMRDLTGDTGNLTNEIEGFFVSAEKAVRPTLAAIGMTGKELKRASSQAASMAYNMNVGEQEVVDVMVTMKTQGEAAKKAMSAMNMTTKDWVKLSTAAGIKTDYLSNTLGDMVASWEMSPKLAADTANNVLAIGQAAGIGKVGIDKMGDAMKVYNEEFVDITGVSGKQVATMTEQIFKLSGAYREMGLGQEEAAEVAIQTGGMFAKEFAESERVARGQSESYGEMTNSLMALVGTDKALEIMKTGAFDAAKGMQMMQEVLAGSNQDSAVTKTLMAKMSKELGGTSNSVGWLAGNLNTGAKALDKFANLAVDGTGAIKKLGEESYTSGFTLQERFDRAKTAMDTMIRKVGRKEVRGMVKVQAQAYREVGKEIQELGSDETWGPLMKNVSIFKQAGAKGVMMNLGKQMGLDPKDMAKTSAKFEVVFDTIKDVGAGLSPIMETLGMFGPLGILAGGIAGFFMLGDKEKKAIWNSIKPLWTKHIMPMWDKTKTWALKKWDEIKVFAVDKFGELGSDLEEAFPDIAKSAGLSIWKGIKSAIQEGVASLGAEGGLLLGIFGGVKMAGVLGGVFGPGGMIAGMLIAAIAGAVAGGIAEANQEIEKARKGYEELTQKRDGRWGKKNRAELAKKEAAGAVPQMTSSAQEADFLSMQKDLDFGIQESKALALGSVDLSTALHEDYKTQLELIKEMKRLQAMSEKDAQDALSFIGLRRDGMTTDASMPDSMKKIYEGLGRIEGTSFSDRLAGSVGGDSKVFANELFEVLGQTALLSEEQLGKFKGAGSTVMGELGKGVKESAPVLYGEFGEVIDQSIASQVVGNSPPPAGPLSKGALPDAGANILRMMSDGMWSSQDLFQQNFASILETSFDYAMEAYNAKVDEAMKNSEAMKKLSDKIIERFGGDLGVTANHETKIETKKSLQAALSIPGIAGVTAAVVSEGAKQRTLLKKIQENTQFIADSAIIKGKQGASKEPITQTTG